MAYLDRENFIAFIDKKIDKSGLGYVIGNQLKDYINKQPTADVVEVKHGHWIKRGNEKKCSVCGFIYYSNKDEWNGCPNCLAKMDGRSDT